MHHEAAQSWFAGARTGGWATCAITEAGFVRVSCNPSAVTQSVTMPEAIALLDGLEQLESRVWSLDRSVTELPREVLARLQGYRQVTDAVLLALAMHHDGQLATLDAGLTSLVSKNEVDSVYVIPV